MRGRQSVAGFLCRALTKAFNKNVNYINNKAVGAGKRRNQGLQVMDLCKPTGKGRPSLHSCLGG